MKRDEASAQPALEKFIKDWAGRTGGAERADAQTFLNDLCRLLDVDTPHEAQAAGVPVSDYSFERVVRFRHDDGSASPGRIDLYKKGCFVLEAKQSNKRREGGELFEQLAFALAPASASGGTAVLE